MSHDIKGKSPEDSEATICSFMYSGNTKIIIENILFKTLYHKYHAQCIVSYALYQKPTLASSFTARESLRASTRNANL